MPRAAKTTLAAGATGKLELVLDAGGRVLSGVVTDTSGGPIAGARVDVARVGGLARASDAVAMTTTGGDGRYKLTVDGDRVLVGVNQPDYAPQSRYVDVPQGGATADFKLVPGGVIEGIVKDERTHEPVAGARVEAARDQGAMMFGEMSRRHALAGADGRFRITGLRPGSFELTASAPGRFSRAPTIVGLGVAEQITDVVILVAAGRAIRGFVRDEANAPAPGVEVGAMSGNRDVAADERSDAKGAFVIDGLSPGRYMVGAGASDTYVPGSHVAVDLGGKDADGVIVTVRHGARVKGHVEPRQVCDVRLDPDESAVGADSMMLMMIAPVTTAADGEFSLGPIRDGAFILSAHCASGDRGKQTVAVTPALHDLVLPVSPGASIAGRVVDTAGKPVAGVTVSANPQTQGQTTIVVNGVVTSGAQVLTAANGGFEINGLDAGPYRLGVLDRGRPLPMKHGDAKFSLAATEHKTGVELVVDRPDGVLRGTVTGPDGKPLADAWVSVQQGFADLAAAMEHGDTEQQRTFVRDDSEGAEAATIAPVLTDAAGHFEISGLPRTSWTVVAEAQAGKLRGRAERVTPDATVAIQMLGVAELHGTVHVAGPPPPSFDVVVEGPGGTQQRTFAWTDGTFSFARVDAGTYQVHVMSSAGNGDATATIDAQGGTVDITLSANAFVIGRITDATGKPLGGVAVTTVPDDGSPGLRIQLDAPPPQTAPDGTFRVESKAGTRIVVAMTQPRPTTKRGVVLEAGKTTDAGTLVVDAGSPTKP
jgi:protocatechuate 3,4-dioxygenase beta subunit